MAEIVNLKRFKKAKARVESEKAAEANRVAFGRTRAEKEDAKAAAERAARDLDGKKLDE